VHPLAFVNPGPVNRYLLDTNVISELRKASPHGAVVEWIKTLRSEQIFLSAVTMGELQAGVEVTRKSDATKAIEIENWLTLIEPRLTHCPWTRSAFGNGPDSCPENQRP
jgi:predicted nucleic acid-binding protein